MGSAWGWESGTGGTLRRFGSGTGTGTPTAGPTLAVAGSGTAGDLQGKTNTGTLSNTESAPVRASSGLGKLRGTVRSNRSGAKTLPGANPGLIGGGAGNGAATPGATGTTQANPIDQLYQDILAQHQGSWAGKQDMLQGQMAAYQRQAAAMGGAMGRSVAGGWGGMMNAAWGKGLNQMTQAKQAHDDKTNSLQLAYMDNLTNRTERQKDRDLQSALKQAELAAQYGGQDANGTAWQSYVAYRDKYGEVDAATDQKIRDLFAAGRGEEAIALIQQLWDAKIK